jgi:hypothetical protein
VTLPVVEVGEPTDPAHATPLLTDAVLPVVRRLRLVVIWNAEPEVAGVGSEPQPPALDEGEEIGVQSLVDVSENEERLAAVQQRDQVLNHEAERRVRHDDIRFIEQRQTLIRAEVTIALKRRQDVVVVPQQVLDVSKPDRPIAVSVGDFGDLDLVGTLGDGVSLAHPVDVEQRQFLALDRRSRVARRDQLLDAEASEVDHEVLEEVRFKRVVAVAQDDLVLEVLAKVA